MFRKSMKIFKQKFKLTKELKEKFLFQENLLRELEE